MLDPSLNSDSNDCLIEGLDDAYQNVDGSELVGLGEHRMANSRE